MNSFVHGHLSHVLLLQIVDLIGIKLLAFPVLLLLCLKLSSQLVVFVLEELFDFVELVGFLLVPVRNRVLQAFDLGLLLFELEFQLGDPLRCCGC